MRLKENQTRRPHCPVCGKIVVKQAMAGGRPRTYCSNTCRTRAATMRRAEAKGQPDLTLRGRRRCPSCRTLVGTKVRCPECDIPLVRDRRGFVIGGRAFRQAAMRPTDEAPVTLEETEERIIALTDELARQLSLRRTLR